METNEKLIIEAQKKRFQQILEYTNFGAKYSSLDEAGDENENQPQGDGQMPPQGENMPADGGMPQDGGTNMGGGMPDMGGDMQGMPDNNGQMPTQGENMPVDGGMPQDGGSMDMNGEGGGGQAPEGFNPQDIPADGGDVSEADFEGGVSEDDDVVDISELTDAQEETDDRVKEIGGKFNDVLRYIGKFEELLKSNNDKIEKLKDEFEKRNPTQVEKLSMQTAHSYPFSETPESYWANKEATSNYSTEDDNNGVGQEQYTITKGDIEKDNDWRSISKSLDDENNPIFHPTLKNTMNI